jgi:glycosidase
MALGFALLYTNRGVPLVYYGDEIGMPGAGDPDNRRFMQWSGYSADQLFLRGVIEKLGAR